MADRIITPDTFARNRSSRKRSSIASGTGGNVRNIRGGSSTSTGSAAGSAPDGPLQGTEDGSVTYSSSFRGLTRNKPIKQELFDILVTAARATGVRVIITSGGQDSPFRGARRTGSRRHDNGFAADLELYSSGALLSSSNNSHLNIIKTFVNACFAAGATAVGAGNGYMSDTRIHVDIADGQPGVTPRIAFWGGKNMSRFPNPPRKDAGAPLWLREIIIARGLPLDEYS
jgi:hypothetical protein